ncbi:MAG: aspartate aminotransferase family protein, partial [Nitrospiraceae bacterium]
IFVEPIQGEGGLIVPPDAFLKGLRRLCDRYGILLVDDEVQTGMGRTGKWFAIEHAGVMPDIICMAKALGGGLPLGGIIARKQVMTWERGSHTSTFGGNPVACEAGLATIEVIE